MLSKICMPYACLQQQAVAAVCVHPVDPTGIMFVKHQFLWACMKITAHLTLMIAVLSLA